MYDQQYTVVRTLVSCLVISACLVGLVSTGIPVVSADHSGDPVSFYGYATDESGEPLPQDTEIIAVSESGDESSIEMEDSGWYGNPDGPYLTVSASPDDNIAFYRDSTDDVQAAETVKVDSHSIYKQNLTFTDETISGIESLTLQFEQHLSTGSFSPVSVTATYDNGEREDVTDRSSIRSSNPDVAEVSGETIFAEKEGESQITATFTSDCGAQSEASETISVTGPELTGITVDVDDKRPVVTSTTQIGVEAAYTDNPSVDVTDNASISVKNNSVARVEDNTLYLDSTGTTTLEAEYEEKGIEALDSVNITVQERTPTDLDVDIDSDVLGPDQTTQISATAFFDQAQDADVSTHDSTSIKSSDSSVISVDGSTVTAHTGGTATLTITYTEAGNEVTDSVSVTVDTDPIDLQFSTAPETLLPDTHDQLELDAVYSDGTMKPVTAADQTSYDVINTSVVTIDDGVLYAHNSGTTAIDVSYTDQATTVTETIRIDVLSTTEDIQPAAYANISSVSQDTITTAEEARFTHDSVLNVSTVEFSSSMLASSVTADRKLPKQSLYAGNLSSVPERVTEPDGTVLAVTELTAVDEQVGDIDVHFPDLTDQYAPNESDSLQLTHHDGTDQTTQNITDADTTMHVSSADTADTTDTTDTADTTVTTDLASPSTFVLSSSQTTDDESHSSDEDDPSTDKGESEPDPDEDDNELGLIILVTVVSGGVLGTLAIGVLLMYRDTGGNEPSEHTDGNDTELDIDDEDSLESTVADENDQSEKPTDSESGSLFES